MMMMIGTKRIGSDRADQIIIIIIIIVQVDPVAVVAIALADKLLDE